MRDDSRLFQLIKQNLSICIQCGLSKCRRRGLASRTVDGGRDQEPSWLILPQPKIRQITAENFGDGGERKEARGGDDVHGLLSAGPERKIHL